MRPDPQLSIILPVHNEAESLPILWEELAKSLARLGQDTEVIFVDDASTDASVDVIRGLMARDDRVRLLRFETHSGLTAVFFAGLKAARGSILATMDSDLQNDPRDLEVLLASLGNADAAVGARVVRYDSRLKRISSRIANAIRNRVTGDHVLDSACSMRVMRRECLQAFPPYNGMHRFFPTLLRLAGHRVVEVPIRHRSRRFGRSKFGIRNRAVPAFFDLLAVSWMMRRRLRYRIAEEAGGEPREAHPTSEAPDRS